MLAELLGDGDGSAAPSTPLREELVLVTKLGHVPAPSGPAAAGPAPPGSVPVGRGADARLFSLDPGAPDTPCAIVDCANADCRHLGHLIFALLG